MQFGKYVTFLFQGNRIEKEHLNHSSYNKLHGISYQEMSRISE